jgi:hypothetical protein
MQKNKIIITLLSKMTIVYHIIYITFTMIFIFYLFWCLTPLSAISWRPVLVVEEAGVPRKNHRPWASNW